MSHLLIRAFSAFSACDKQKKQIPTYLGKAIPCTFSILFFPFQNSNLFFVQIGPYIISTFPSSNILFVLF
jgi:hypothetical protein